MPDPQVPEAAPADEPAPEFTDNATTPEDPADQPQPPAPWTEEDGQ
jgi:hypothetical protein